MFPRTSGTSSTHIKLPSTPQSAVCYQSRSSTTSHPLQSTNNHIIDDLLVHQTTPLSEVGNGNIRGGHSRGAGEEGYPCSHYNQSEAASQWPRSQPTPLKRSQGTLQRSISLSCVSIQYTRQEPTTSNGTNHRGKKTWELCPQETNHTGSTVTSKGTGVWAFKMPK